MIGSCAASTFIVVCLRITMLPFCFLPNRLAVLPVRGSVLSSKISPLPVLYISNFIPVNLCLYIFFVENNTVKLRYISLVILYRLICSVSAVTVPLYVVCVYLSYVYHPSHSSFLDFILANMLSRLHLSKHAIPIVALSICNELQLH